MNAQGPPPAFISTSPNVQTGRKRKQLTLQDPTPPPWFADVLPEALQGAIRTQGPNGMIRATVPLSEARRYSALEDVINQAPDTSKSVPAGGIRTPGVSAPSPSSFKVKPPPAPAKLAMWRVLTHAGLGYLL